MCFAVLAKASSAVWRVTMVLFGISGARYQA